MSSATLLPVFVIAKWEGLYDPSAFADYLSQQSAGRIDPSGMETAIKGHAS